MISLALFGLLATLIMGGESPVTFAKQEVFQPNDTYFSAEDEMSNASFPTALMSGAEACGVLITALESGLVVESREDGWNEGRGIYVKIEGAKTTAYIHLGEIFVTEGDMVRKGDPIGAAGRSALSTKSPCVREVESK